MPLIKNNQFVALLAVQQATPRQWTETEIKKVEETADRTWAAVEHARIEVELQKSQEQYRTLFESIDEGYFIADVMFDDQNRPIDIFYLEVNPAVKRITGLDLAGCFLREIDPNYESHWWEALGRVAQTGIGERQELYAEPLKSWFSFYAFKVGDTDSHRVAAVFQDITERKNVEQERDRFLAVGSDLQAITGIDGYFRWVSPMFERLLGWTPAEMTARPWTDFVHPDDIPNSVAETDSLFSGTETLAFENRYRHKDGSCRWFLWNAQPYREEGVIYGAAIDITERKQVEESLRLSEQRLKLAVKTGKLGSWQLDLKTNKLLTSEQCKVNYGVSLDADFSHQVLFNRIHVDDRAWVEAAIQQAIAQHSEYDVEYRTVWDDGTVHWVLVRGTVVYDIDRTPLQMVGMSLDITDRKQAEIALHESRAALEQQVQKFDVTLSTIADYVFSFDRNGRFLYANQALLDLWGVSAADAIGKTMADLDYPPTVARQILTDVQQLFETGVTVKNETAYTNPAGVEGYFEYILSPVFAVDGTVESVIGSSRNIRDRKQAEAEREQLLQREQAARTEAERANRIKDEFLAVLSHELRSPLNPILGWTRLLQNGRLDEARRTEALNTIERNAKLQSRLIEDLLDISRIMQGKLSLTAAPVSLTPVISAAVETVRLAAEAKNIQITLALNDWVAPISGDAGRLQQVVWNLLTNAVKFTPNDGAMIVELRQINDVAQIRVIDTGKGITSSFLPHVFEYFLQEDGSTTRKFGGLGLGLAIVRQIVEMHGGTVRAESEGENQGATFIVRLPILHSTANAFGNSVTPVSELTPPQTEAEAPLANLQILLVDDEADAREFEAFVLEQSGATVKSVSSGLEALQALDQFTPDVLVSDIGMAEMDGYMLIQQIRSFPSDQGGMIRAIALTAYAAEVDQQRALRSGFQAHLTKPVDPENLVNAIVNLLHN